MQPRWVGQDFTRHAAAWSGAVYNVGVLGTWLILRWGDQHWLPTLLLFGPRWVYAAPLLVLIPLLVCCRLWIPSLVLIVSAGLMLGSIIGVQLSAQRELMPSRPALRVLSCNVQGAPAGTAALRQLVAQLEPDVIALQECGWEVELSWLEGWHLCRQEQLVIASRHPLQEQGFLRSAQRADGRRPVNALHCRVKLAEEGEVDVYNVHLRTPRAGFERLLSVEAGALTALQAEIVQRHAESVTVQRWIESCGARHLVCGDFNMPDDSSIYRACWSHYANAFATSGVGCGYTKQTTLRGWSYGLRIDHILAPVGFRPIRCWTGNDVGSDHRPVVADFEIP